MPLRFALLTPGPDTATDVAFTVLHETDVVAGAMPVAGLAEMEPETDDGAVTETVTVCVAGPPGPCAVIV